MGVVDESVNGEQLLGYLPGIVNRLGLDKSVERDVLGMRSASHEQADENEQ